MNRSSCSSTKMIEALPAGRFHKWIAILQPIDLIVALRAPENISPSSEPGEKLGVHDFFKHPEAWTFRLSPDGKWISCLKPSGTERRLNIFVRPLSDGQAERRVTAETKSDILGYFWKGNDYLLYSIDRQRDENPHLCVVDLRKPEPNTVDLTEKPGAIREIAPLDDIDNEMLVYPDDE